MNEVLQKLCRLLIVVFFIGNLSIAAAQENNDSQFLQQNLSVLTDRNGEIVSQKRIEIESEYKDRIDCFKIKYLSDGLEIVGFILKPNNVDSKLPVLIFNRGGNREYFKIKQKTLKFLSYWASNNYTVIASQYRGNDGGQGREQFGGTDINDVLDLIPLAKSLSFTDKNNVFMLGFSRGGMMTYLALKYGAQVNAAVVVAGMTDIWKWYLERDDMRNLLGLLVGLDKEEYYKRSAVYWPEKINAPILIMHGKKDIRVSYKQSVELSEKLSKLGKEYKLIIFPKGDHGLSKHKPERNEKILEWFDKYKK